MGIARSTYYREPVQHLDDAFLLVAITAISDEFEAFGWSPVQAALQHQSMVANHMRTKPLMREHNLQPSRR